MQRVSNESESSQSHMVAKVKARLFAATVAGGLIVRSTTNQLLRCCLLGGAPLVVIGDLTYWLSFAATEALAFCRIAQGYQGNRMNSLGNAKEVLNFLLVQGVQCSKYSAQPKGT